MRPGVLFLVALTVLGLSAGLTLAQQEPEVPTIQVPSPTTLQIDLQRAVTDEQPVAAADADTAPLLPEVPVIQVPTPTTLQINLQRAVTDEQPVAAVDADPVPLLPDVPVIQVPAPTTLKIGLQRTGGSAQPAISQTVDPDLLLPDVPQLPVPEPTELTVRIDRVTGAVDQTVGDADEQEVPLPETANLTATATKPAVDTVTLPEPTDLSATVTRPATDSVSLPETVTLGAAVTKPAIDAVPLPGAVDLRATVSKPTVPQVDNTGPPELVLVSIQLDSVDPIRGFNPLDDQEVARIEDSTGFANNDDDGNDNGGDLDLSALVPGGTLVEDTDGLDDGNFFFSVFCLAPGNNVNIVVGANGASLFGVTRNNVGGPSLSPTGRFTTFNGDNVERTFEFADNVATVATVTSVVDDSLLANVTVAANSTGFILLADCQ